MFRILGGCALCILIALVVLLAFLPHQDAASEPPPRVLKIAAGPEGSTYAQFAEELVSYLKDSQAVPDGVRLALDVQSSGSVGNLRALAADDSVAMAISQEDVAFRFYRGRDYFFPERHDDTRDYTCLVRLYDEHFYLCVRPGISRLNQIANLFVWGKNSGSFATYYAFAEVYHPEWQIHHEGDCEDLFRSGAIDGFISVESPREWLIDREDLGFKLFSVNRSSFVNASRVYGVATLPPEDVPGEEPYETISIACVLVAVRALPASVANAIAQVLDPANDPKGYVDRIHRYFPKSADLLLRFTSPRPGIGTQPRFAEFVMPSHPAAVRRMYGGVSFGEDVLWLAVWSLLLLLVWMRYRLNPARWAAVRVNEAAKTRFRCLLLLFGAFVFTSVMVIAIKQLERWHFVSGQVVVPPPIMEMPYWGVMNWLFVFLVSGFESGVFPVNPIAKICAVLINLVYLVIIGYLLGRGFSHLTSEILSHREKSSMGHMSDHILICNWNRRGRRLVEELPGIQNEKIRLGSKPYVVILARDPIDELPAPDLYPSVRHVAMDPWDPAALDLVCLSRAQAVVVLLPAAVESTEVADGCVVRTCLALRNAQARYHGDGFGSAAGIAAEVSSMRACADLEVLGIDDTIVSRAAGMKLLAQAVTCPGVTQLFNEILDTEIESNEVYEVPMPSDLLGVTCDFWSIVSWFHKRLPRPAEDTRDDPVIPIGVKLAIRNRPPECRSGSLTEGPGPSLKAPMTITALHPRIKDFRELGCTRFTAADRVVVLADVDPEGSQWLTTRYEVRS